MIFTPQKLICANVGDSRIVLGRKNLYNGSWQVIQLTRDHKPSDDDERTRILLKGGRVKSFKGKLT